MAMKILFVGDIVGSPGREMLADYLPKMNKIYQPDAIIVNGENATNGKGLNEKHYHELIRLGVQVITMGNHTFAKKQIFDYIDENARIIRPANYPKETPGVGYTYIEVGKQKLAVINIQARTFMPSLDCPFTIIDKILQEIDANTWIFVDFHGEATSEKIAMGWYLDGRVHAVVGTHTHVPTADARILPKGTAYITDVGMTGPYDAVLGVSKEKVLEKFITALPVHFEVDTIGRTQLCAVLIKLDEKSRRAIQIQQILINPDHPFIGS